VIKLLSVLTFFCTLICFFKVVLSYAVAVIHKCLQSEYFHGYTSGAAAILGLYTIHAPESCTSTCKVDLHTELASLTCILV